MKSTARFRKRVGEELARRLPSLGVDGEWIKNHMQRCTYAGQRTPRL